MEDIKVTEEDIQELFRVMPEAELRVTIIAQRRRIQELENTVDAKSKDKLDIKKAKVSGCQRLRGKQCVRILSGHWAWLLAPRLQMWQLILPL